MNKLIYSISALLTVSLVNSTATADMAPLPEIISLTQEGQNVVVRTLLVDNDFTLERKQGDTTTVIADGSMENATQLEIQQCRETSMAWEGGVPVEPLCEKHPDDCHICEEKGPQTCVGTSCDDCTLVLEENNTYYPETIEALCEKYPEYAEDCDDDGIKECCLGTCESFSYYYDFEDECVPDGDTTYTLTSTYETDIESITVELEETCEAEPETDSDSEVTDSESEDVDSEAKDSETSQSDSEAKDSETSQPDSEAKDSETSQPDSEAKDSETGESNDISADSEKDSKTGNDDTETDNDSKDSESDSQTETDTGDNSGCQVIGTGSHAQSSLVYDLLKTILSI